VINPPFIYGSGGVEQLALEMTNDLQRIKWAALEKDTGEWSNLITHGVSFGKIRWTWVENTAEIKEKLKQQEEKFAKHNCNRLGTDRSDADVELAKAGNDLMRFIGYVEVQPQWFSPKSEPVQRLERKYQSFAPQLKQFADTLAPTKEGQNLVARLDTSMIEGVSADLVVRPFGRKGNNATTRDFDCGAIRFHQGIEPVEVVGHGVDHDKDGYINEIGIGQMSALAIFNTTTKPPVESPYGGNGEAIFKDTGCADCHMPELNTATATLAYHFPEVADHPMNPDTEFYAVDLKDVGFAANDTGSGVKVRLFSDLKLHAMGEGLQETLPPPTTDVQNQTFITARLWGIADTAPYLHDGRATTLTDAIHWHGGEAKRARDHFVYQLTDPQRRELLEFLRSLRTPASL